MNGVGSPRNAETGSPDTNTKAGRFLHFTFRSGKSSIFNTTQILFGLDATGKDEAVARALNWINAVTEPDGRWKQAAYIPGFEPSYYIRGVWAVLSVLKNHSHPELLDKMGKALSIYQHRILPNGAVEGWGFWPGQWAYTHTIAYTLRGFLECSILLDQPALLEKVKSGADQLINERNRKGRWAGAYNLNWEGRYSFLCLTGCAQLSVLYRMLFDLSSNPSYKHAADELLKYVLKYQQLKGRSGIKGGIPGSSPVWGRYMRFRYPQWGVKFFLDAAYPLIKG